MISISLPNIAVQKVTNGYVVEWTRAIPDEERKGSEHTECVLGVAHNDAELIGIIQNAANDLNAIA